jgi:hypothetical protein
MSDTAVVSADDSAQPNAAVANTLENLDANVNAELDSQNDATVGTDVTPTAGEPDAATATPVDNAEVDGKLNRITQDNEALRVALRKIGVDPDSDTVRQLNSGLITKDDLFQTSPPVPDKPPTPTASLEDELDNLSRVMQQRDENGAVTADTFDASMKQTLKVMQGLIQENKDLKQARDADAQNQVAQRTAAVTQTVFDTDVTVEIPDAVKDIAKDLFQGAVDNAVYAMASDPNIGRDRAVSPEGYEFAAKQLAPKFIAMVNAIKGVSAPAPQPTGQVRPLAPGAGGGSPPPPAQKGKFTLQNLDANVQAELAGQQLRV